MKSWKGDMKSGKGYMKSGKDDTGSSMDEVRMGVLKMAGLFACHFAYSEFRRRGM